MEHGFVISAEQFGRLAANLANTYLGIAEGMHDTEVVAGGSFTAAINKFEHPICNFAVCEDAPTINVAHLRELAASRTHFNIYVPHFGNNDSSTPHLTNHGFQRIYTLIQMCWTDGRIEPTSGLQMANTGMRRHEVSVFMADQFFTTQPPEVRNRIARATECATQFELFELKVGSRQGVAAAVMLHQSNDVLGLYNLCVSYGHRSRGHGGAMVKAAKALARDRSLILGLQCDHKLQRWYSNFGLSRVGTIDVFGLTRL